MSNMKRFSIAKRAIIFAAALCLIVSSLLVFVPNTKKNQPHVSDSVNTVPTSVIENLEETAKEETLPKETVLEDIPVEETISDEEVVEEEIVEETVKNETIEETSKPTESTIEESKPVEPTEESEPVESIEESYIGKYFTEYEIVMVAQTLWAECRGVSSTTEKACVVWVIVNRVDAGYADSIFGVLRAPHQFAWRSDLSYTNELYDLAEDVLIRWSKEKDGEIDVGRVLPSNYYWFKGDGVRNYFRDQYNGDYTIWDYSLPSPYED